MSIYSSDGGLPTGGDIDIKVNTNLYRILFQSRKPQNVSLSK